MNDLEFFDKVDQAVEQKFSDQASDAAPEGQATKEVESASADQAPQSSQTQGDEQKSLQQAILDLSKAEKFIFNGKEMTPKDLEKGFMLEADYRRKTQELAETRKYAENIHADLRSGPTRIRRIRVRSHHGNRYDGCTGHR
jgi:hypothetical protein